MTHVVEEAVMGAVVICGGDEGRRRDPTLFLTHVQMARAVMKSPGHGIHLHGGVCPEGPPPRPNPDPLSPAAPARVQATPFPPRGPVQAQVRPGELVLWGAEMGFKFPGVTQFLPQEDPTEG